MSSTIVSLEACLAIKQACFWEPYANPKDRSEGGEVLTLFLASAFDLKVEFIRRADDILLRYARAKGKRIDIPPERSPMPISRYQLLLAVVKRRWEPAGHRNPFEDESAELAQSGELLVVFTALSFRWDKEHVREQLAGVASGHQYVQSMNPFPGAAS